MISSVYYLSFPSDVLKIVAVVAFSSKSGGKNGKLIAVQLFQYRGRAREFRPITNSTLLSQTKQYLPQVISFIQFLCLLDTKFSSDQALPCIEVTCIWV